MYKWTEPMPWWTQAQRQLADETRTFMDGLRTRAHEVARTREFPWDAVAKIAERGWYGVLIPEQYGGIREQFGGIISLTILGEELGRLPALTMNFMATAIGGAHQITDYGSDALKERWLPQLAKGKVLGAIAITEPFAGSDASGIDTRAWRSNGGWVIRGKKRFISNIGPAGIYLIYARTGDDQAVSQRRHLSVFVLEKGIPGFHIEKFNELSGFQYLRNGTIDMQDVWVPDGAMIGEEGQGWEILTAGLNVERLLNVGVCVGGMRESLDAVMDYTHRRLQFQRPLLDNQAIQFKVADMAAQLHMARIYLHYSAYAMAQGDTNGAFEASVAKLKASEFNLRVALDAVQAMGGDGYTRDYPVEQILRDAKLWELGGGSVESLRGLIYRQVHKSWEGGRAFPAQPPAALDKQEGTLTDRVLGALAAEYRRHPALYSNEVELQAWLGVSMDELTPILTDLADRNWVKRFTGERGLRLVKATYEALQAVRPLDFYQSIPDWVPPNEVF